MHKRLFGVLVASIVVASACGSSSTWPTASLATGLPTPDVSTGSAATSLDLTTTTYSAIPAAKKGGKITLAEWQWPTTLNPYYWQETTDIEVSDSMFSNLVDVTPDLKYVPDLATSVPTLANGGVVINGSGMDVTWKLHPNMQWSDSSPINCDDIKATWMWMMNKDNAGLSSGTVGWQDVTGVDGGGGTTCVMHFGKIYEGYLTLVSPVLPARYLTTIPVKSARTKLYNMSDLSRAVFSGPYIPTAITAHSSITLKPNPYWSTISGHAPWLAAVTWKYYGDANTMIDGFRNGEYDLGQGLDNTNAPALTGVSADQQVVHDSSTYEQLAFNNASFSTKYGVELSGKGLIDAPQPFATNRLVVIVPAANPAHIAALGDLARPGVKLVIGDPTVPIGTYTRTVLADLDATLGAGYSAKVLKNVVSNALQVTSVVSSVELGEADAGFVYVTDAQYTLSKIKRLFIGQAYQSNPLPTYPIAVVKSSTNAALASQFTYFVLHARGQAILKTWGFLPPPAPAK